MHIEQDAKQDPVDTSGNPGAGRSMSGSAQMRIRVASILRLSDALVARAVSAYDRLFSLDRREEAEMYLDLGTEMVESGRAQDALPALQRVVKLRPKDAGAWVQLGILHLRQGASTAAIEAFDKARALGDRSYELHLYTAEAQSDLRQHEIAVKELQAALDIKPDVAEANYRLGVELDQLKRHEEAVKAFEKAIEKAPREAEYYQSLGFTLDTMGRRDEAVDCFKRALDLERKANHMRIKKVG
ncbi:MAG: tetratricopeptide repeat protein [Deltaproteobacteria bacterium]|nr:tetratricopeptide repeat protein [Deltaproteobacteria bacterium]